MNIRISWILLTWLMLLALSGCQAPQTIPTATPSVTANPTETGTPLPASHITSTPSISPSLTPTLEPGVEIISVPVSNDISLSGTIYQADGDALVIFAHMGSYNQTSWAPLARKVADNGIPAFTFDFRCSGKSGCFGMATDSKNYKDLMIIMDTLRQHGYKHFVCVGASLGGAACINISLREELAGLVIIASAKQTAFETKSFPENLVSPDMPKLFIYNEKDHYKIVRNSMPDLYASAPEPKMLQVLPGQWHGTENFKSPNADQFSQVIMDFLLSLDLE